MPSPKYPSRPYKPSENQPTAPRRNRTAYKENAEAPASRETRAQEKRFTRPSNSPHKETSRPWKEKRTPHQNENTLAHEHAPAFHHNEDEMPGLVLGLKPVLEMLESAPERIDCIFLRKGRHKNDADLIVDLCRSNKIRFSLQEVDLFNKQFPGSNQGVVARLFSTGFVEFSHMLDTIMDAPLPLIVALDQVQDPGNAGTLARSLYALGGAGLVLPKHNSVFLGGAALKASAGALEKLPVARAGNLNQALDEAKKCGITIYGAQALPKANTLATAMPSEGNDVISLYTCTPRLPALLVLGSEEAGIREHVAKRCDVHIGIPMLRDFDSINVAQAGAMILSWFAFQHTR